jgi:MoaA/NifB/PqqE/SkfB family radical SAM enzyme
MSAAKVAVLMLLPKCNMDCQFCITEDNFQTITMEQAKKAVDQFARDGIKSLVIGGGEPLTWPHDLLHFCAYAQSKEMHVQVGTNGVELSQDLLTNSAVDRWVLPLESVDEKIHNQLRLYRNNHQQMILRHLQTAGIHKKPVTISTVVTSINVHGVLELAQFLKNYQQTSQNIHAWHLYQFVPQGRRGEKNQNQLRIPHQEYMDIVNDVFKLKLPFRVFRRRDMPNSREVDFYSLQFDQLTKGL